MKFERMVRFINFWPPFLFNGIKATHISKDLRKIDVQLKYRRTHTNNFGTQYGGHLFSMTDPWYMLMLVHALGKDYYVWDKKASIDFISPGRTNVFATIELTQEKIDEIKAATASGEKYLPEFVVELYDQHKKIVARVHRTVYVKRKPKTMSESKPSEGETES